jgi:cyclopropane fatty-acyl-phospholipid synthase-like methyltransferase
MQSETHGSKFLKVGASLARVLIPESIRRSRLYSTARHLIVPHDNVYDRNYYAVEVSGAASASAAIMAKSMFDCFKPISVIDVGCGTGALLASFRDCGCEVNGLEYSKAGIAACEKLGLLVRKFNIERDDLTASRQYDIVTSFEVAEHIPSWHADRYVDLLCRLAPLAVMSAATPGQGGTDHVNEQPHSYWIEKFIHRGYNWDEAICGQFAEHWRKSGVASFYYENVMVFRRRA